MTAGDWMRLKMSPPIPVAASHHALKKQIPVARCRNQEIGARSSSSKGHGAGPDFVRVSLADVSDLIRDLLAVRLGTIEMVINQHALSSGNKRIDVGPIGVFR